MWFRLDCMDQVGKLHRILDDEHRNVVADQVLVAFVGIEFHREATNIPRRVFRTAFSGHF